MQCNAFLAIYCIFGGRHICQSVKFKPWWEKHKLTPFLLLPNLPAQTTRKWPEWVYFRVCPRRLFQRKHRESRHRVSVIHMPDRQWRKPSLQLHRRQGKCKLTDQQKWLQFLMSFRQRLAITLTRYMLRNAQRKSVSVLFMLTFVCWEWYDMHEQSNFSFWSPEGVQVWDAESSFWPFKLLNFWFFFFFFRFYHTYWTPTEQASMTKISLQILDCVRKTHAVTRFWFRVSGCNQSQFFKVFSFLSFFFKAHWYKTVWMKTNNQTEREILTKFWPTSAICNFRNWVSKAEQSRVYFLNTLSPYSSQNTPLARTPIVRMQVFLWATER